MSSFAQQTRWRLEEPRRWVADIDPTWGQGRATFGGLVSAAALEAMVSLVDGDRSPRAVKTSFLRPVAPGPAVLSAEVLRAGRALTTAEARITQDGKLCATVEASFGADRPSNLVVTPSAHPHTEPADDSIELPYIPGVTPAFTQHFGYRWEGGRFPFSGAKEPVSSGWCQHRTPIASVHGAILGMLDSWPAPMLTMATKPFPASTVSWTAAFVDVPAPEDAEGWWYFKATPVHSAAGYATTRGSLYAPDGRLAAHMDQLVVIFDA